MKEKSIIIPKSERKRFTVKAPAGDSLIIDAIKNRDLGALAYLLPATRQEKSPNSLSPKRATGKESI